MAVELEIRDGNPWYLSTDIWTVPNDPNGPAGMPIAGDPCYVYVRVRNNGSTSVYNATVKAYWADPSVGFDRNTAHYIGSAYVTLGAGETYDALILTPWFPEFVNEGHECVVAEAFHETSDPLPASPAFNVPTDRHVAQRNLSVLETAPKIKGFFALPFYIENSMRLPQEFKITAISADLDVVEPLLRHLGPKFRLPPESRATNLGFVDGRCPGPEDLDKATDNSINVKLAGNRRLPMTLVGRLEKGAAAVHVEQRVVGRQIDEPAVNGLTVLILSEEGRANLPSQDAAEKKGAAT